MVRTLEYMIYTVIALAGSAIIVAIILSLLLSPNAPANKDAADELSAEINSEGLYDDIVDSTCIDTNPVCVLTANGQKTIAACKVTTAMFIACKHACPCQCGLDASADSYLAQVWDQAPTKEELTIPERERVCCSTNTCAWNNECFLPGTLGQDMGLDNSVICAQEWNREENAARYTCSPETAGSVLQKDTGNNAYCCVAETPEGTPLNTPEFVPMPDNRCCTEPGVIYQTKTGTVCCTEEGFFSADSEECSAVIDQPPEDRYTHGRAIIRFSDLDKLIFGYNPPTPDALDYFALATIVDELAIDRTDKSRNSAPTLELNLRGNYPMPCTVSGCGGAGPHPLCDTDPENPQYIRYDEEGEPVTDEEGNYLCVRADPVGLMVRYSSNVTYEGATQDYGACGNNEGEDYLGKEYRNRLPLGVANLEQPQDIELLWTPDSFKVNVLNKQANGQYAIASTTGWVYVTVPGSVRFGEIHFGVPSTGMGFALPAWSAEHYHAKMQIISFTGSEGFATQCPAP